MRPRGIAAAALAAIMLSAAGCGGDDATSTEPEAPQQRSYAFATFPVGSGVAEGDLIRYAGAGAGVVHAVIDGTDGGRRAVLLLDAEPGAFPDDLYAVFRSGEDGLGDLVVLNERRRGVPLDGPMRLGGALEGEAAPVSSNGTPSTPSLSFRAQAIQSG